MAWAVFPFEEAQRIWQWRAQTPSEDRRPCSTRDDSCSVNGRAKSAINPVYSKAGDSTTTVRFSIMSGYLWFGSPNEIIELGRANRVRFFTSEPLLDELADVVSRDKFAGQFDRIGITPDSLIARYRALANEVTPATISSTVPSDPDDDAVLACAKAADADYIVTGDPHLLRLGSYFTTP